MQMLRAAGCSAVLALVVLSGCKKQEGAAGAGPAGGGPPPAPVTLTTAQAADVPIYLDEIGTVEAVESVQVQPQVNGQIFKIHFTDGQDLKAGDMLFTIDPRPYEATLAQRKGELQENKAALDLAKVRFRRTEDLIKNNVITQEEYDTRQNAVETAEAKVATSQATLQKAQLDLDYTRITSPIDGRAGRRLVDVGNVVTTSSTLLSIQRITPIYVTFTTVEQNLDRVRDAMKNHTLTVQVSVPGSTGKPVQGELTFLDNTIQTNSGRLRLRATLPNEDRALWPGQFVNVRLILEIKKDAVLVPDQAVQMSQPGPFVYAIKDGKAELRLLKLGQHQGDKVVVDEGVAAGEPVVLTGHMKVVPGGPVIPMDPNAQKQSPATKDAQPEQAGAK